MPKALKKTISGGKKPYDEIQRLENINLPNNYYDIISFEDLKIGKDYSISTVSKKTTTYGERVSLVFKKGGKDRLLFLSPSYNDDTKFENLKHLSEKYGPKFQFRLEGVKIGRGMNIPLYSFFIEGGDDEQNDVESQDSDGELEIAEEVREQDCEVVDKMMKKLEKKSEKSKKRMKCSSDDLTQKKNVDDWYFNYPSTE
ncbi:hypothetical protein PVAND_017622 [Polypedilum vanderplanki]|uniref:Uncharacterized protein n=1 Tax=Polypedilum vanderplanki TaxID=319348 RepID=A0A9J6B8P1_POLVA|nr:hypothetical protein PVAND_017622 [Polypedilum vanderplanki]